LAKVLLHPNVTTSSIWLCSRRSRVVPIRSKSLREHGHEHQPFARQGEAARQSAEDSDAKHLFETFHLLPDRGQRVV